LVCPFTFTGRDTYRPRHLQEETPTPTGGNNHYSPRRSLRTPLFSYMQARYRPARVIGKSLKKWVSSIGSSSDGHIANRRQTSSIILLGDHGACVGIDDVMWPTAFEPWGPPTATFLLLDVLHTWRVYPHGAGCASELRREGQCRN
jgi:hypothetical protein